MPECPIVKGECTGDACEFYGPINFIPVRETDARSESRIVAWKTCNGCMLTKKIKEVITKSKEEVDEDDAK